MFSNSEARESFRSTALGRAGYQTNRQEMSDQQRAGPPNRTALSTVCGRAIVHSTTLRRQVRLLLAGYYTLNYPNMKSGYIGTYCCGESVPSPDMAMLDTLRTLGHRLNGLRAANVSWDSGLLVPSDDEKRQGWTVQDGRAISPVIDDAIIDAWPWCDGGFEAWYFFLTLPSELNLSAFCNWTGLSIADWASLVNVPYRPQPPRAARNRSAVCCNLDGGETLRDQLGSNPDRRFQASFRKSLTSVCSIRGGCDHAPPPAERGRALLMESCASSR